MKIYFVRLCRSPSFIITCKCKLFFFVKRCVKYCKYCSPCTFRSLSEINHYQKVKRKFFKNIITFEYASIWMDVTYWSNNSGLNITAVYIHGYSLWLIENLWIRRRWNWYKEMLKFQKNLFSGQLREGYPRPRYILSTLDTMMNISEMKVWRRLYFSK